MIELYNNLIIILLIIVITIIFSNIIYRRENFQNPTNLSFDPYDYFGKIAWDGVNPIFNIPGGVIDRLSKDPEVLRQIRQNFKKDYYGVIIPDIGENQDKYKSAIRIKETVDNIPRKFAEIIDKYKNMNNVYNLKKKQQEAILLRDFKKQEDITTFNVKNLKLKHKLKKLTDTVVSASKKGRDASYIMLKNNATNTEITLVKNTQMDNMNQYSSGTSFTINDSPEYYSVSINNKCLSCMGKSLPMINNCDPQIKEQLFLLHEIKNNESYNKMIKMSGNYRSEDIIDILDTSIDYPFYIISPFMVPGYCLYIVSDQLSLKPIRNDIHQRFTEIFYSTFCKLDPNTMPVR